MGAVRFDVVEYQNVYAEVWNSMNAVGCLSKVGTSNSIYAPRGCTKVWESDV